MDTPPVEKSDPDDDSRRFTALACWMCGKPASWDVLDTDTDERLLACDGHKTSAFS